MVQRPGRFDGAFGGDQGRTTAIGSEPRNGQFDIRHGFALAGQHMALAQCFVVNVVRYISFELHFALQQLTVA